jgi:hypothetical protein
MATGVLDLFEGLTEAEARLFRTRLMASARQIRTEIRPPKRRTKTKNYVEVDGMKATAELQRIEAEIEAVQAQQEDLRKAGVESGEIVTQHQHVLGREVLDDKKIDESARVITRENARAVGIQNAQAELTDKLAGLGREKSLLEARMAVDEYEQAIAQVDGEVTGIFRSLFSLRVALARLNDGGTSRYRAPHGFALPASASGSEAALRAHGRWELLEDFKLDEFLREALAVLEIKQPGYYKEIRDDIE